MTWVLKRQGALPDVFDLRRMGIAVGPKGEAHFLLRVDDRDDPERVFHSGGVRQSLGRWRYGLRDVFLDGRILLAGFPSKRADNDEKTAVILSPEGAELVRLHTGYGVEDIQVGPDGRIWVSYFDEGVYSGGELPSHGLVALDQTGEVVWKNRYRVEISDCYALNVSSAGVWFCPYTDIDLCRVMADGSIRQRSVHGAHAFAIHADHVLFAHQYREAPGTVHLADIGETAVGAPKVMQIVTEDGLDIPQHGIFMRGGFVHVFAGDGWYRGHLSEIV